MGSHALQIKKDLVHSSFAKRWGSVAGALVVAGFLFAACASADSVATVTVTGSSGLEEPGEILFESACASCHGDSAQGGAGPALAGHTAEQIIRQVRAPVGEMPRFAPNTVSPHGLDGLVEMIIALPASEMGAMAAHAHDETRLSKQEVSQIQHALILQAVERRATVPAEHLTRETMDALSGNHLAAMIEVVDHLDANRFETAEDMLVNMAAVAPLTRDLDEAQLLLTLALNEIRAEQPEGATHWVEHIDRAHLDDATAISEALLEADLVGAMELIERELPSDEEHDEEESEGAHDGTEGEVGHADDDADDDAIDPPPADHDDGDAAPHDD